MDATNGHYVAYILNNDKWLLFDDTSVTEASEADVLKQQSYILFYERNGEYKQVSMIYWAVQINLMLLLSVHTKRVEKQGSKQVRSTI